MRDCMGFAGLQGAGAAVLARSCITADPLDATHAGIATDSVGASGTGLRAGRHPNADMTRTLEHLVCTNVCPLIGGRPMREDHSTGWGGISLTRSVARYGTPLVRQRIRLPVLDLKTLGI